MTTETIIKAAKFADGYRLEQLSKALLARIKGDYATATTAALQALYATRARDNARALIPPLRPAWATDDRDTFCARWARKQD